MRAAPRVVHSEERPGGKPGAPRVSAAQRRGTPVTHSLQRSLDAAFEAPLPIGQRRTAARLWDAWQALDRWEEAADDELGETLGELLLVLWSLHRMGYSSEGEAALGELIDDQLQPTFGDAVLKDLVGVSFALGAAWADQRRSGPRPVRIR